MNTLDGMESRADQDERWNGSNSTGQIKEGPVSGQVIRIGDPDWPA